MATNQKVLLKEFNKLKKVNKLGFHVPSMSAKIEMEPRLHQGRDHIPFANSRGAWGTLRLRLSSDPKEETGRLFRIYYGPWRTSRDRYIVLTKGRDILLELGFTTTSHSVKFSKNNILIRHLMGFSKRGSANNSVLIADAMRRAEKLGLEVDHRERSVHLRTIDLRHHRKAPVQDQEVIKRFILSGLAKRRDLWTAPKEVMRLAVERKPAAWPITQIRRYGQVLQIRSTRRKWLDLR